MDETALLENYLVVGALLFGIGLVGFFSRRNMIVMFLSTEMMLQGVSVSLVAWGRYHNDWGGQMLVIFILTIAACEAAIALALMVTLFQRSGSLDIAFWQQLREENQPGYVDHEVPELSDERPRAWPHLPPAGIEPRPTWRRSHTAAMYDIEALLVLIPALPLAATVVTALFGKHVLKTHSHWPTVLALVASCACSLALLREVQKESQRPPTAADGWERTVDLWTWANIPRAIATPPAAAAAQQAAGADPLDELPFRVDVTLRVDGLTAIMLAMVTFIASLVAIYASRLHARRSGLLAVLHLHLAVRLFHDDAGVGQQLRPVVRFWEAVGLCSYLLIGFWFEKPEAAAAGKKAFLVNRIGDFGFALGLFLIWTTYGTLNFHDAPGEAPGVLGHIRASHPELYVQGPIATAEGSLATGICLLLLLGACGKSAQFPLHVWLPDAMEGPTPGQRPDPRRHDGDGRRVHGRALHAAVFRLAGSSTGRRHDRRRHRRPGVDHRAHAERFETGAGLLHHRPVGIHVSRAGGGRLCRSDGRHVSLVHARLFQSLVVPRRRQRDARHGRGHRHAALRRAAPLDAHDLLDFPVRLAGTGRRGPLRRLLEQGCHPGGGRGGSSAGPRLFLRVSIPALRGGGHGAVDFDLHVSRVLSRLSRQGASAARSSRPRARVPAFHDAAAGGARPFFAGSGRRRRDDAPGRHRRSSA